MPTELAEARYLPRSSDGGREANLEDPFDPGHTYKYAAPGPQLFNGDPQGNYALWVPTNFPNLDSDAGKYYSSPKEGPVRWALWSLGPKPRSARAQSSHAPMSSRTWYCRTGDAGVIVRYANHDGLLFKSP